MSRIALLSLLALTSCFTNPKEQLKNKKSDKEKTEVKKENEKKNGLVKSYYSDGKIFSVINYKDGLKHGMSYSYFSNGNINLELPYVNGKREGQSKRHYENGKLYQTTEYKNNLIHGFQKKYRENGKPISESRYENDNPCLGLKEYLLNESLKKNYPQIVITPVDELVLKGKYTLLISMSDKSKKAKFYEGNLTKAGCFSDNLNHILLNEKTGVGAIVYTLPPGGFLMKELNIVALVKTTQGNIYLTQKKFNLSVDN